jgi:hypothetical protein
MTEDQCPVTAEEIDVLVAADIPLREPRAWVT